MGVPSTVKILRPSVRNEIFTTSHQALITHNVMVMLKMQLRLVKTKAQAEKHDPLLALLEWRNKPAEGRNASPVKLLFGRRTRTCLPAAKQFLTPQVISDVPKKTRIRKQKHYYDRNTCELLKLLDGDAIRIQLPHKKKWSLGM